MPGLVPGIHVLRYISRKTWMGGGRPAPTGGKKKENPQKHTFSPASPFARKVRIAAIELGLIDKIEFVPTTVVPGQPNDAYSDMYPLKKLPPLILDNGEV